MFVNYEKDRTRQRISAHKFLIKAIQNNGKPELINIDKSGSNNQAIKLPNIRIVSKIKIQQCKYLNNIVEQGHRKIKWRLTQSLGYKNFESVKRTIAGIEIVHMLEKNPIIESCLQAGFQSAGYIIKNFNNAFQFLRNRCNRNKNIILKQPVHYLKYIEINNKI